MRVADRHRQCVGGVGGELEIDAQQLFDHVGDLGFFRAAHADHGQLDGARRVLVHAERLLIEMRDRLDALTFATGAPDLNGENRIEGEAWSALVALGYKPTEVTQMLKPFAGQGGSTEELIRRALQGTVRSQ